MTDYVIRVLKILNSPSTKGKVNTLTFGVIKQEVQIFMKKYQQDTSDTEPI